MKLKNTLFTKPQSVLVNQSFNDGKLLFSTKKSSRRYPNIFVQRTNVTISSFLWITSLIDYTRKAVQIQTNENLTVFSFPSIVSFILSWLVAS